MHKCPLENRMHHLAQKNVSRELWGLNAEAATAEAPGPLAMVVSWSSVFAKFAEVSYFISVNRLLLL